MTDSTQGVTTDAYPDLLPEGYYPVDMSPGSFHIAPEHRPKPGQKPVVVSYGAGRDSSAMLVKMYLMWLAWLDGTGPGPEEFGLASFKPNLILFAHVGNEWPETYEALKRINEWLISIGWPPVTIVQYVPKKFKHQPYGDLFGNCIANKTLPSMSFGMKGCSLKWKASIMDKFVETVCVETRDWLKTGNRIQRLIGYDAGPKDKCRGAVAKDEQKWEYVYPLRSFNMDREACGDLLVSQGFPLIHKSACVFCASMQIAELIELAENHPDLLELSIILEDNASEYLEGNMSQEQLDERHEIALCKYRRDLDAYNRGDRKSKPKPPRKKKAGEPGLVQGLWRSGVAGKRDPSKYRPGSWRQFCEERGLFNEENGLAHLKRS